MHKLRIAVLLLIVVSAFAACKKGGGYIHTSAEPVAFP
jgi:hypothetical protein